MTHHRGIRNAAPVLLVTLALAAILALVSLRNAYNPTDDGFVLSLSWRITRGELPYRDFIYIRPPLTLYVHAIWFVFPDGWQIALGRLAFYIETAVAAALPAVWAVRAGLVRVTATSISLVGTVFLLAVHNFPPQPWYTIDGVLLSSIGLVAFLVSLEPRSARWRMVAAASLALATLAKQSFAGLVVLLVLYAVWERIALRRDPRLLAATVLGSAGVLMAALVPLAALGALGDMRSQLAAASTIDLFLPLVDGFFGLPHVPDVIVFLPAAYLVGRRGYRLPAVAALGALVTLAFAAFVVRAGGDEDIYLEVGRQLFLWLLGTTLGSIVRQRRIDRLGVGALGTAAVALSASFSAGYPSPVLGLLGAGIFFLPHIDVDRAPRPAIPLAALALTCASVIGITFERPFKDVPRAAQTADLGTVYGRFGSLYTSPENVGRFAELRDLIAHYAADRPFVVMRGYALIYFLEGRPSPISADAFYADLEYRGQEQRLTSDIDRARPALFVERIATGTVGAPTERDSCPAALARTPLLRDITRRGWILAGEGSAFCAYRPG